jgi:hypothetical protein
LALTVFLTLTTVLTAMQVELAVQSTPSSSDSWRTFSQVSRWFSIIVIILVLLIYAIFTGMTLFMFVQNMLFARAIIFWKKSSRGSDVPTSKYSVVGMREWGMSPSHM